MYGGPQEPCLPEERNAGRSTGEPDAPFSDGGPNVRPHPRMGDPATDRGPTGDRRGTSPFAAVTFKINAGAGFSNRVFWARQMDLGPWRRRADGASPDGSRKLSRHFSSPPRSTRRGLSPTWVDLAPEDGSRPSARAEIWTARGCAIPVACPDAKPPRLGQERHNPRGRGKDRDDVDRVGLEGGGVDRIRPVRPDGPPPPSSGQRRDGSNSSRASWTPLAIASSFA